MLGWGVCCRVSIAEVLLVDCFVLGDLECWRRMKLTRSLMAWAPRVLIRWIITCRRKTISSREGIVFEFL